MKRYSLLSVIVSISVLAAGCSKSGDSAEASTPPPTPVQLETLKSDTLQDTNNFVGTLEAYQTVQLEPQIDGRINQVMVAPGDLVQQGQLMFLLDLDQTAPQLNSAVANVNSTVAARNTAAQQLQVAQSQLSSAQSQAELARVDNERYSFLATKGAVDQSTADRYTTTLKVDRDAVEQARKQVNAAKAGVNQASADINKAQADANAAKVSVDFKRVVAPITGLVGNIAVKQGDYVTTGQTLTTINKNETFDLQIPVPISHADELRAGLPVKLIDPNTENLLSVGSIYFVSSKVDPNAQSVLTRAKFSNTNGNLRDSQYVKASIVWDTSPGVLVPVTAVKTIGGQSFVFTAANQTNQTDTTKQNNKTNQPDQPDQSKPQLVAHQVPVTLGQIQGQDYQITKGLKPGDRVIISGIQKLRDGAAISPQSSNAANAADPSASAASPTASKATQ